MTNVRSLVALAVVAAFASAASAQPVPATRADVKAEARAANKAGTTAEGEKAPDYKGPAATTGSTASRTDVKADARAANKAGTTAEGEISKQEGAPGSARVTPAAPATR